MEQDDITLDLKQLDFNHIIFIDIRTRGYYMISHIENAINIESPQRIAYIAEENQDKIIALYCHTGSSATQMAQQLIEQGHKNVKAIAQNFFHLDKYGIHIVGEGRVMRG